MDDAPTDGSAMKSDDVGAGVDDHDAADGSAVQDSGGGVGVGGGDAIGSKDDRDKDDGGAGGGGTGPSSSSIVHAGGEASSANESGSGDSLHLCLPLGGDDVLLLCGHFHRDVPGDPHLMVVPITEALVHLAQALKGIDVFEEIGNSGRHIL